MQHENVQQTPKKDLSPKEQVERRDAHYSIASRDLEAVTRSVIVKRGNNEPDDGWLITGDGVDPKSGAGVVRLEKLVLDDKGNFVRDEQGEPIVMSKVQRTEDVMRYDREQRAARQTVSPIEIPAEQARMGETAQETPAYERPTVDNPHLFNLQEDAVQIRRDDRGELSVVAGFYYDDNGEMQEIVKPMNMAGYDPSKIIRLPGGQPSSTPEKREQTRNERLFAAPKPQDRDRFGNDQNGRLRVTEQSLIDADEIARYSDSDVRDFLMLIKKDNPGRDVKELLRTDNELRVKLGEFLLEKQDGLRYLPARFHQNNQTKNANYIGYPSGLSSREYAALLALSMLDGTYKKPTSDPIEIEYGDAIRGQHRYAAMMTLGVENSPLARSQMKTLR